MEAKSLFSFKTSTDYFSHALRGKVSISTHTKRMGYRSPRLLEMICRGDRLPSSEFLFRYKEYKRLSDQEFIYIGLLVRQDKLRLGGKRDPLLEAEIESFSRLALSHEHLNEALFRTIADWQYLVLKQLFRSPKKMTIPQIEKALKHKISADEIRHSLLTLAELGVIHYDAENDFVHPRKTQGFVSPAEIPSHAIRSHHRQMMQRAQESLDEVPLHEREIVSLTFSFDPKNIKKVKEEIARFRDRIEAEYIEQESKRIYQLNIQLFPHTV